MPEPTKRGRGRPTTGTPVLIRLTPEQLAWIDGQGRRPEVIRQVIQQAMAT